MAEWSSRVQNALAALPRPPVTAGALEVAGLSTGEWSLLVYCFLCEPPFSLDELHAWLPYTSEALLGRWLRELLATLNVQRVSSGDFIVTDKGVSLVKDWCSSGRKLLAGRRPLSGHALKMLADGLEKVVEAALEQSTVKTVRLTGSRRLAFEPLTSGVVRIDQALTDLYHWRDDCHTAVWRARGLTGPETEALTLVWRGEVKDVSSLVAVLGELRGHEAEQVTRLVKGLGGKGLIASDGDQVELTATGRSLREAIEAATDRNYMCPWTVLPPAQLQDVGRLLASLTLALRATR